MAKHTSIDDKRAKNQYVNSTELTAVRCACGLEAQVYFFDGFERHEWQCPDLECGRQYAFEYIGRRREPELKLVHGHGATA